jgi:hypothetical protein
MYHQLEEQLMQAKIGAGSSRTHNPEQAGRQAVENALAQLSGQTPKVILLASTEDLDPDQILAGARSAAGAGVPLVGGCSSGVIVTGETFTQGVAALAICSEDIEVITGSVSEASQDTEDKVHKLMQSLGPAEENEHSRNGLVVSWTSVQDHRPGATDDIIRHMGDSLNSKAHLIGGLMKGPHNRSTFLNDEVQLLGSANAALLTTGSVGVGVKHGYAPYGQKRVVTKSKDNIIYEIDHKPVIDVYAEELPFQQLALENFGKYALDYPLGIPQENGEHLIRDPYAVQPDGSVLVPVPIPEQTTVQIMLGNRNTLILAAKEAARQAKNQIKGEPLFALVFSCVSRLNYLGVGVKAELISIQAIIGMKTPVIGCFSHGEIAVVSPDVASLHNKTVVVGLIGR